MENDLLDYLLVTLAMSGNQQNEFKGNVLACKSLKNDSETWENKKKLRGEYKLGFISWEKREGFWQS